MNIKANTSLYFDNNATTPLAPEVLDAMRPYFTVPTNPSSIHSFGRSAKSALNQSRATIAQVLDVSTEEIYFTASATEALNTLFHAFASGHVISTNIEHSAIDELLKRHPNATQLPIKEKAPFPLEALEQAITPETSLLLFSYANSETGTLFPIESIADIASRHNIPLVLDGVALFGKGPMPIYKGVTAIACSGHKIHGPPGSAFFYLKKGTPCPPLIVGGGQERGVRSGSENLPAIVGLAHAVSMLEKKHHAHLQRLRDLFETRLLEQLPSIQIHGGRERLSNTSNIYFPQIDAETLLIKLDMLGIAASQGSACSAGAREPSRILTNMEIKAEEVRHSLRFSFSRYNTESEVKQGAAQIAELILRIEALLNTES